MIRSLRVRIQLWNALILAVVIIAFGSVLYLQQRNSVLRSCQEELRTQVAVMVSRLNSVSPRKLVDYLIVRVGREKLPQQTIQQAMMVPGPGLPLQQPPPQQPPRRGPDESGRFGPPGNWLSMMFGRSHLDFIARRNAELDEALTLPASPYDEPGGRKAHDKAYFCIWVGDGVPVKSSIGSAAEFPAVFPGELNVTDDVNVEVEELSIRFRQNGIRLEAFAPANLGTSVLVGRDIGRDLGHLQRTGWWIFATGCLTWVLGLGGGWLLSRGSTRPIGAITRVAGEISESQLDGRIDVDEMDLEFVELSQTLNKTFSRLESAIERQRQFTADASHELRTPLAILQMQQQLALSKTRTPEEYQRTLKTCVRAVERMNQLVESLLLLARVDSGNIDEQRKCFDLGVMIQQEIENFEWVAREKDITLSEDAISLVVRAHDVQIRSVINNLLANAINYSPAGGIVKVSLSVDDQNAILRVCDAGEGIPADELDKVFDRFYRVNKERSRETGGLGIGLSLCKTIIEKHGGDITVTSETGEGSQFSISLPIGTEADLKT
ncbi:MAG: ATP-binding protein [Planctomycetota bacterium]